jgi:hypothetical protein
MSAPITVHHQTIRGSGDRGLAVEQAHRRRRIAANLERDLAKWQPEPGGEATAEHVREEVRARIKVLREEAREYEDAIRAFDDRGNDLTPGEIASGIRRIPLPIISDGGADLVERWRGKS